MKFVDAMINSKISENLKLVTHIQQLILQMNMYVWYESNVI